MKKFQCLKCGIIFQKEELPMKCKYCIGEGFRIVS